MYLLFKILNKFSKVYKVYTFHQLQLNGVSLKFDTDALDIEVRQ